LSKRVISAGGIFHAVFCKVTCGDHCFAISSCAARLPGNQSFAISFSFYVLSAVADGLFAVADGLFAVAVLAFQQTGNSGIVRPGAGFGNYFLFR
jgi:hypothetical protein